MTLSRIILTVLLTSCLSVAISQTTSRLPCLDKKFSVVAHIFRDTFGIANIDETTILATFQNVNQYFAPICISFEVCEFKYYDNFQYDLHEQNPDWNEMQNLHHVNHRINIYYVNEINDPQGACGYAGLGQIVEAFSDGLVIKKTCASTPKTHAHELGHYFGLEHTFMSSTTTELVDASNCTSTADNICDTPADPFVRGTSMGQWLNGCTFISTARDANGDFYDPLVGNIMSYYPDECICGFTDDQLRKMAQTYLNGSQQW